MHQLPKCQKWGANILCAPNFKVGVGLGPPAPFSYAPDSNLIRNASVPNEGRSSNCG